MDTTWLWCVHINREALKKVTTWKTYE